jgi:hypothetical protein
MFSVISALSVCGSAAGQIDESMIVEPKPSNGEAFPESTASASGILTIKADPSDLACKLHANVLYATKSGIPLHLYIIEPKQPEGEKRRFPLVVYVQGSAWFKQDLGYEIPQLSRFARKGYVIAVVEHRPSPVGPFPAQLKGCQDSDSLPDKERSRLQHRFRQDRALGRFFRRPHRCNDGGDSW